MWLFTLNSFVSVVRHRDESDKLLVRARRRKDLMELLGKKWEKAIFEDLYADYRYRVIISEKSFKAIISSYITKRLDYDNFKAAQSSDDSFNDFLHKVWHLGYRMQKNPTTF
jgi:hypothetical protein